MRNRVFVVLNLFVLSALGGCSDEDEQEEPCLFEETLQALVTAQVTECGTLENDQHRVVEQCVADAIESGQPFIARYQFATTDDSSAAIGVVDNGDEEIFFVSHHFSLGHQSMFTEQCQGPIMVESRPQSSTAPPAISCTKTRIEHRICP